MPTNRQQTEAAEFVAILTQEFPHVDGIGRLAADLMRLARRHQRLQEKACNEQVSENHDAACEETIRGVCDVIGCTPVFSGDPRGATVKLKVPSGRTTDWGGVGICVPA